ncbi:hypothetical protein DL764_008000 [Monosporascus ibericus]|uniref:DNA repair protein rhp7 treble clef domain-containing protein n=1 Tax=Monosporascus ibericus TaxID=155417 RepID=A0A4Q4SYM4_9PEZI|nr:hypothetical protein DL764_008000 [Monosporascus ibericus]
MLNHRGQPTRSIRGPRSALTDFLESRNISAARIRADADARRNAAATAATAATSAAANGTAATTVSSNNTTEDVDEEAEAGPSTSAAASRTQAQKRKKQQAAIEKIKKTKAYKKRKLSGHNSDSDDAAFVLFNQRAAPPPGQTENCEICEKRFTVTPYSQTGPNGGLVCPKCAKDLKKDDQAPKKTKKKAAAIPGGGRRKLQSKILDGVYQTGAKSLLTLCIEVLAKNIELADDLGDLPPALIDRIARLLSKQRLMNPQCLGLFLRPDVEEVMVYDGARLATDDYIRIFATASKLKKLKVRNAIQFKDEVMAYLLGRHIALESLSLHGANLVTQACWKDFLAAKGKHLRTLQVYYTDRHFDDDIVASLKDYCPSLNRLKIYHNQEVSDAGVKHIANLKSLEHLGLHLVKSTTTEPYVRVIKDIGERLRTLSIRNVDDADDRLLDAIHENCTSLTKLRIQNSEVMTDSAFARLFNDWKNKPLTFIDLEKCRHVDSAKPRENPHLVGLCSDGFKALMNHSGRKLRHLNVHSCRHISSEAFEEVFSFDKEYPELVKLEISFCEQVTDFIVGCIFRACPKLRELNVFGCMKVKGVVVPKGRILVGVPNAIGMVIEGPEE